MSFPPPRHSSRRWTWLIAVLVGLLMLTLIWNDVSFSRWELVEQSLQAFKLQHPALRMTVLILGVALACVLAIPLTITSLLVILLAGPIGGGACLIAGATLGGAASFMLGKWLGLGLVAKLAGSRIGAFDQVLQRHGIRSVVVLRLIPIAPYAIVNMLAGVSSIRLRDFLFGTVLGMTPGVILIAVFIDNLIGVAKRPTTAGLMLVFVWLAVVLAISWFGRRWLDKHKE